MSNKVKLMTFADLLADICDYIGIINNWRICPELFEWYQRSLTTTIKKLMAFWQTLIKWILSEFWGKNKFNWWKYFEESTGEPNRSPWPPPQRSWWPFLQTLIKRTLSKRGLQKFGPRFKLFKQKYQTSLKVHEPLH